MSLWSFPSSLDYTRKQIWILLNLKSSHSVVMYLVDLDLPEVIVKVILLQR